MIIKILYRALSRLNQRMICRPTKETVPVSGFLLEIGLVICGQNKSTKMESYPHNM
ncbi:hypothetical protein RchiOBHm_Chr5g0047721 [Rosa chinensis]|uniref:Uncharacterized protein n=1 Tax=Rosa chinensis TaxID=74649 RepID=A0A2P6QEF6_ROSCH|nr:hypothetical protein RchiOBHm_Chr5g0047721 [Rosa chinensis]